MTTEQDLASLEEKITQTIQEIKEEKITPQKSGIGKMLGQLKELDQSVYNKVLEIYKPVSKEYFDKYNSTEEAKKIKAKKIEAEIKLINSRLSSSGGDLSDDELKSGTRNHAAKEAKVKQPKIKQPKAEKPQREKGDRDRKPYKFNGGEYGKGQLVLAVIRHHVSKNPNITVPLLKQAFPDHLLKGYGIFQELSKAQQISEKRKRFFLNADQLVKVKGGTIAICNQFSSENIYPFLDHAKKNLGYEIE